jgi:hypothetical protein
VIDQRVTLDILGAQDRKILDEICAMRDDNAVTAAIQTRQDGSLSAIVELAPSDGSAAPVKPPTVFTYVAGSAIASASQSSAEKPGPSMGEATQHSASSTVLISTAALAASIKKPERTAYSLASAISSSWSVTSTQVVTLYFVPQFSDIGMLVSLCC